MSKYEREIDPNTVPIRLAAAVAIVGIVFIGVISFVFMRTVREWKVNDNS